MYLDIGMKNWIRAFWVKISRKFGVTQLCKIYFYLIKIGWIRKTISPFNWKGIRRMENYRFKVVLLECDPVKMCRIINPLSQMVFKKDISHMTNFQTHQKTRFGKWKIVATKINSVFQFSIRINSHKIHTHTIRLWKDYRDFWDPGQD